MTNATELKEQLQFLRKEIRELRAEGASEKELLDLYNEIENLEQNLCNTVTQNEQN